MKIPDYIPKSKKPPEIKRLINEALHILHNCGLLIHPTDHLRKTSTHECCGTSLLAVANVYPKHGWAKAGLPMDRRPPRSRDIIAFANKNLGMARSFGSYDDVRRRDLHHSILAGLVVMSAADPDADRNDGTRGFGLSGEFQALIRKYGTAQWVPALREFMADRPALSDLLAQRRQLSMIPVTLPQGGKLNLSPGPHNELQRAVVEKFLPIYGYGAEVLYLGDAAKKHLFVATRQLQKLKFFELDRGDLPDVVAWSSKRNWIYLIEAVHSVNPITPERLLELQSLTASCLVPIIYVTAFLTRDGYRRHASDLAWETEVWIAETPEHLIHLNGEKFLGPYRDAKTAMKDAVEITKEPK